MITLKQKREVPLSELEAVLRDIVSNYDWAAFFQKVQPVWIDFRKPEKPLVFLMPDFRCPCGGTFFINVHFVAMPHDDHQRECPFAESYSCTRRHGFQVLIEAKRNPQTNHLDYYAVFRVPVAWGRLIEIAVPIAVVED
jgi:hypothetical protein